VTSIENAIGAEEADRAFECLKAFDVIVLAVSGGPDSLALLSLAAEWVARSGSDRPTISVATVDHGLRAQSADEARTVADIAAAFGLKHTTLLWTGAKPQSGMPNAARAARYALLDAFTRSIAGDGRAALVTAHHLDDQAETVFMRLARGGGVAALAAMPSDRALSKTSPVRLVRPLLGFSKSRLVATVARRGLEWVDDPTNSDQTF
jgi:tRNA(Ile)-lysidine synthase